jgi:iron(III) transport system substrate-binding protein
MKKLLLLSALLATSCAPLHGGGKDSKPIDPDSVRIYTSLYPDVIEQLKPIVDAEVAKRVPGIKVDWVQGGSERIRKRVDQEMADHFCPGDVLLTSDPAYYQSLAAAGKLVPYDSPEAARQPGDLRDPSGSWATARFSTMVIGIAADSKKKVESFKDLMDPAKDMRISIGDPDFSGTNLTTVGRLVGRYGWDYYKALKEKKAVVAGSNGTVMDRVETGTTDAGVVLLENLLAVKAKGSKVKIVFPSDGAIVIPGPIALLPHSRKARGAKAVYDALLSVDVQKAMVEKGFMHAADPSVPPPTGAPVLDKLLAGQPLSSVYQPLADPAGVKKEFAALFSREAVAQPEPSPTPSASPAPKP